MDKDKREKLEQNQHRSLYFFKFYKNWQDSIRSNLIILEFMERYVLEPSNDYI